MAVTAFLMEHGKEDPVSFHMPGHKGAALYRRYGYEVFLRDFLDYDITEIPGADNLFQPEGVIAQTMEKYRRLYGAEKSYLLVNGTSGGILAAVLACVHPGGELIMARNCHKSVFNALQLGNIRPVYAYPQELAGCGIAGAISPEEIRRCLREHPEAEAVILPSPNYYGVCSDIEAIAKTVHEQGKVLIVDQAHGAHLKFFENMGEPICQKAGRAAGENKSESEPIRLPPAAESCGADIVIGSIHKTLASLTQSALLNVMSRRIDIDLLEDKLQAVETTSPSYILMGSLDICADILEEHSRELMRDWQENLAWFYHHAAQIPGLTVLDGRKLWDAGEDGGEVPLMDGTKLNLDMSGCGLTGSDLEAELMKRHIYPELITGNLLMCMTGIGNVRQDYERLRTALQEIAAAQGTDFGQKRKPANAGASLWLKRRRLHDIPAKKERVPLERSEGRICAGAIIPYPPGIPLICPGEEIGPEEIAYVRSLRRMGEKVIGVDAAGQVAVGEAPEGEGY